MASNICSLFVTSTLVLQALSAPTAGAPSTGIIQMPIAHFNSNETGPLPLVDVGLGSPPQKVTMIFDTGSSDMISPRTGSSVCQAPQQLCTANAFGPVLGSFDPTASAGIQETDSQLNITFGTGESYQGPFVKTNVALGDKNQTLPGAQIGLQEQGFIPEGTPSFAVFGVGPVGNEGTEKLYSNVPIRMKEANVTKTSAYGVYLNDFRGSDGSIAFGGVDRAKFEGDLQSVPLLADDQGKFSQFVVSLSSMSVAGGPGQQGQQGQQGGANKAASANFLSDAQPALLDTGNPGINIPSDAVRAMAQALGVEAQTNRDVTLLGDVPCSLASMTMVFGFDNDATKINVPLDVLMTPGPTPGQCSIPSVAGAGAGGGLSSIGNPFLQASYAVFDSEGQKILLGQARMNVTESDLVEYTG